MLQVFQPNVIISFDPGTTAILTIYLKVQYPVISMLHGNPKKTIHRCTSAELKGLSSSDIIQVLLPAYQVFMEKMFQNTKIICIPNAIDLCHQYAAVGQIKQRYKIVNVGRLHPIKGQQQLIDAFALIAHDFPDWDLEIWGRDEGIRRSLQESICRYSLEQRIFLKGETENIFNVYASADIFAFPSISEGFGLTLAEAMSAGVPGIGLASCEGSRNLIISGRNGLLVEDGINALANGLMLLMKDQRLRKELGNNARTTVNVFAGNTIWDKWEQCMESVQVMNQ